MKLRRTLQERGQDVRFVQPDQYHVTLAYLGELSPIQVNKLEGWITKLEMNSFKLRFKGLGAFPEPRSARVLWVGVQENQVLLDCIEQIQQSLNKLNIPLGKKEFGLHLPLARMRNAISVEPLLKLGLRKAFGDYQASQLTLFESVLQGQIIKFIPTHSVALKISPEISDKDSDR